MKWIIIVIAWLLLSFPLAVVTGKIIHRNTSEENMKGGDTHAERTGDPDAD